MQEVLLDNRIEKEEADKAEAKKLEFERYRKAMEEFRISPAYRYVIEIFEEEENRIADEIEGMQLRDMKEVFMLPLKEQRAKLAQMSKRDTILTGVLSIIRNVKSRL